MDRYTDPPDQTIVLLRCLYDTWQQAQSIPYIHVLHQTLRSVCLSATNDSRRQFFDMYELTEERTMVYLQRITTDQREMACDNRHMQIEKRN